MEYVFNGFSLDAKSSSLSKGDIRFKIEPRVLLLLEYFCQHPNEAITRDALIRDVWQGRVVGYAAINRAVSELRKVIEAEVTNPKIIITVSKVGYLFDAQVTVHTEELSLINEEQSFVSQEDKQPDAPVSTLPSEVTNKNTIASKSAEDNRKRFTNKAALVVMTLLITILYFFYWVNTPIAPLPTLAIEKPLTTLKGTSFKGDLSKSGENVVFLHKDNASDIVQVWLKKKGGAS